MRLVDVWWRLRMRVTIMFCAQAQNERHQDEDQNPFFLRR